MESITDFKVGMMVYVPMGSNKVRTWVVTDVGTRSIIAYALDCYIDGECWDQQENVIFYDNELDMFSLTKEEC